jgi:hypothetical protein
MSQKRADLFYFTAEAKNHRNFVHEEIKNRLKLGKAKSQPLLGAECLGLSASVKKCKE